MDKVILQQGLSLMLFGMVTVFMFLCVLVFVTRAMSYVVQNYFVDNPVRASELRATATASLPSSQSPLPQRIDAKKLKIIQQAIARHRAKVG